jgi:hypothetical protein
MGQRHLRDASALVLFHAARRDLLAAGVSGIDETLLRAGMLAHLLYLGAAGAGAAVTAIGGFDGPRWARLTGLAPGTEVLYIALLGLPGTAAVKTDRLAAARAHDER